VASPANINLLGDVLVKSGFADLVFYSMRLSWIWLGMCWVWLSGANTPRIKSCLLKKIKSIKPF
jgi:hypothetical protein